MRTTIWTHLGALAGVALCAGCGSSTSGGPSSSLIERYRLQSGDLTIRVGDPRYDVVREQMYSIHGTIAGGKTAVAFNTFGQREGELCGAWLADLDRDGDTDAVIAQVTNDDRRAGVAHVWLQDGGGIDRVTIGSPTVEQLADYAGGDTFDVVNGKLVRSFPIGGPGGEELQLSYDFDTQTWTTAPR